MKRWQQSDGVHLDLRGMSPPDPLVTILREIDGGSRGPIIIHMDRDPIMLYPELDERHWTATPYASDIGGADIPAVTLILTPGASL